MKTFHLPQRLATLLAAALLVGCDVVAGSPEASQAPQPQPSPATQLAPSPTPPAAELLARARAARSIGDDATVAEELSALLRAHPSSPEADPARLLLAESFAHRGNWSSAAELLRPLADGPLTNPLHGPALFWLAQAHAASGEHAAAIAAYERYRALGTPIAAYAAVRQAEQHTALGQADEAAAAFAAAATEPIAPSQRAAAYEQAIAQLHAAGRPQEALETYAALIDLATQPAYRARLLAEAIALAGDLGDGERARGWRIELIGAYPDQPQAAVAADELRAAGDAALAPAAAGSIYLAAERWADAIAMLDAAIAQEADIEAGVELRRLRGLALRSLGNFPSALAALAEAGAISPNSPAGRRAQLDWIQTLGQSGETERAIQGYREFAAAYPDDALAPEALDRVAQLHERLGDIEGALQARLALGRAYPASAQGRAALHQAGLALFEAGRHAEALEAYLALAEGNSGYERARGAFWAARAARATGDEARAEELFGVASIAAADSYYGARAAEELGTLPAGSYRPAPAPAPADWEALAAWVAGWPGAEEIAPAEPASVLAHAERARLLDEVGLSGAAQSEWQAGLAQADAAGLVQLAEAAQAAGAADIALRAAEALLQLAPADAAEPPPILARLRFPTPYAELVDRETANFGVDPLLFYALLRQESLFNPTATSWVGARGLAQVMPETGQGIAQNLGVSDFTLDDLYRPVVSVRFGAFYLGQRIRDMEGSAHGALAAYNGGLGNSMRWAGGSNVADPDLFTERIDYPETQGYVKAVYGFYGAYRRLYVEE